MHSEPSLHGPTIACLPQVEAKNTLYGYWGPDWPCYTRTCRSCAFLKQPHDGLNWTVADIVEHCSAHFIAWRMERWDACNEDFQLAWNQLSGKKSFTSSVWLNIASGGGHSVASGVYAVLQILYSSRKGVLPLEIVLIIFGCLFLVCCSLGHFLGLWSSYKIYGTAQTSPSSWFVIHWTIMERATAARKFSSACLPFIPFVYYYWNVWHHHIWRTELLLLFLWCIKVIHHILNSLSVL